MAYNFLKYVCFSLIFFSLFITSKIYALSIKQPEADLWFSYIAIVDQKTLPSGIIFDGHTLINTTSDPLIIMNGTQEMWMLKSKKLLYEQQIGRGFIEARNNIGYEFIQDDGKVIDDELILDRPIDNLRADNRPKDVTLPMPHTFKINTKYQDKTLIITGKIVYKLNPNYDSKKLSNKIRTDKLQDKLPIFLGVSIFIILIFLIFKKKKFT